MKLTKESIIYEDNSIIVIHKPAGVATETRRIGEDDCVSFVKNHIGPPDPYCAVINRLDQPVEGIVLFARTRDAAGKLSADMRSGRIEKEYLASVHMESDVGTEEKTLTDYIIRDKTGNTSRIADKDEKGAKKAELKYTLLEKGNGTALLKIRLLTGRHHQIRVQLSHAGLPILGDRKYGYVPEGYRGNLCLAAVALNTKSLGRFYLTPPPSFSSFSICSFNSMINCFWSVMVWFWSVIVWF